MTKVIAVVDDDRNILTSVSMALENEGFKVTLKEGYKNNGELITNFIDPIKGYILRSRSNHKINKLKQSKIAGWGYPDSISSLIVDGEKV